MQFTDLVVFKDMEALIMPQLRALLVPTCGCLQLERGPKRAAERRRWAHCFVSQEGVLKSGGLRGFFQTPFY
jgi:hypothetical protein